MSDEAPRLSVIVVNFETPERVVTCLEHVRDALAVLAEAGGGAGEVVVVDNGSRDGSVSRLRTADPQLHIVALPGNRGFAAGANAGMAAARGDLLLLLNSDAQVERTALLALCEAFVSTPNLGVAGAQLVHPDGRLQNASHAFPSLLGECVPKALLETFLPRRFPSKRHPHAAPYSVDAVQGAAMMLRRSVLERIGGLCEDYFFFLEETEWCRRAHAAGIGVRVVPAARVLHDAGASSKQRDSARTRIEFERSLARYFERNAGRGAARVVTALRLARTATGLCAAFALAPFSQGMRRRLADRRALVGWWLAGRPADGGLEGLFGAEAGARRPR